jgi:hypothetical protein
MHLSKSYKALVFRLQKSPTNMRLSQKVAALSLLHGMYTVLPASHCQAAFSHAVDGIAFENIGNCFHFDVIKSNRHVNSATIVWTKTCVFCVFCVVNKFILVKFFVWIFVWQSVFRKKSVLFKTKIFMTKMFFEKVLFFHLNVQHTSMYIYIYKEYLLNLVGL